MADPTDLPIKCACGKVRGVFRDLSPGGVNRVRCCCKFCRDYARRLGREAEMLDADGGTDIFQTSPRRLEFTEGRDHIGVFSLTSKGPARWHTTCCKSPLVNTFRTGSAPFMGVVSCCVDWDAVDVSPDEVLGPLKVTLNADHLSPERRRALNASRLSMTGMMLRFSPMLLWWKLRGDARRSPFFDPETGAPMIPVERVPRDEAQA